MPNRPDRMRRNGRPDDQTFEATEKLFRRYTRAHYFNGQVSNTGISFDSAPSVNREKYSQPQDVIFDEAEEFANWGVLSFRVSDLPTAFPLEDPQYGFSPKHVPMENNYSHSEVWCDVLPAMGMYVKPNKQVRKLFRALLSQRCVVEIIATV